MRLIDKLVLKELIGPFLTGLMMFMMLVFTAGFLFQATSLITQGVPLPQVLAFIVYALPSVVTQTFPMAMLLAALMGFGRLSSDSEAVAVFASGISFPRMARTVLIFGACVSIVAFVWDETVVPPATRAMYDVKQTAVQHLLKSNRPLSYDIQNSTDQTIEETVKVQGGYDRKNRTLKEVTIVKYSSRPPWNGGVQIVVHCARAQAAVSGALDQTGLNWTYLNCDITIYALDTKTGRLIPQLIHFNKTKILPESTTVGKSFNEVINGVVQDSNRLSLLELRGDIQKDLRAGRIVEARGKEVDLYGKIALPLASIIFGLVGAALGLNTRRGAGGNFGFGMAIFIVFLYWVFYHAMYVVGQNGGLPPALASFLADIVGATLGVLLMIRASK